jgi:hypothetical protein
LKVHKTLADVKDVPSLAKQFVDAQSLLGNSIRIPSEDAGEEDRRKFHDKLVEKVPGLIPTPNPEDKEAMSALFKRMGRPDAPEQYEVPEGVDATKVSDFAKTAHGLGLSKSQFKAILTEINTAAGTRQEQQTEAHLAEIRALKQEWGIVYEDNIQLVNSVMKGTGAPKEILEMAADNKLPANALKWLYNIGKQLGTEGINFKKDESTTRLSPAEAQIRVGEIMDDHKGPYWDASHPAHQATVQRVIDLRRAMAAGGLK